MGSGGSQRLRVAAMAALAVLGFGASFGVARATREQAKPAGPSETTAASVAVLPPEAARLVRLAPGGAVPALRPPATTARPQAPEAEPQAEPQPEPQQEPAPEPEPKPDPEPEPTVTLIP